MQFLSPAWFLSLCVVAIAAAWALFRPGRQVAKTPAISIWQQALKQANLQSSFRLRAYSISWWLILIGAVFASLALVNPQISLFKKTRKIAVVVLPSAEISTSAGLEKLKKTAVDLLNRFSSEDKIKLIVANQNPPTQNEFLSPNQAINKLAEISPCLIKAKNIDWIAKPKNVDATYVLGFRNDINFSNQTNIKLQSSLPNLIIQNAKISVTPKGQTVLFASIKNSTHSALKASFNIVGTVHKTEQGSVKPDNFETLNTFELTLLPNQTHSVIREISPGNFDAVGIIPATNNTKNITSPLGQAWFTKIVQRKINVAIIGKQSPVINKYIEADTRLNLIDKPEQADLIFANEINLPSDLAGKPVVLISPPESPAGWSFSAPQNNILGSKLQVAPDIVTENLTLATVAFRSIKPIKRKFLAKGKPLLLNKKQAVICRSTPETDPELNNRWVYFGFNLDFNDTNLPARPAYVILMSNCVSWLVEASSEELSWKYITPIQARYLNLAPVKNNLLQVPSSAIGLFRTQTDKLIVVNQFLVASDLVKSDAEQDAQEQIRNLKIRDAEHKLSLIDLHNTLLILAGACWIAGWYFKYSE